MIIRYLDTWGCMQSIFQSRPQAFLIQDTRWCHDDRAVFVHQTIRAFKIATSKQNRTSHDNKSRHRLVMRVQHW